MSDQFVFFFIEQKKERRTQAHDRLFSFFLDQIVKVIYATGKKGYVEMLFFINILR